MVTICQGRKRDWWCCYELFMQSFIYVFLVQLRIQLSLQLLSHLKLSLDACTYKSPFIRLLNEQTYVPTFIDFRKLFTTCRPRCEKLCAVLLINPTLTSFYALLDRTHQIKRGKYFIIHSLTRKVPNTLFSWMIYFYIRFLTPMSIVIFGNW